MCCQNEKKKKLKNFKHVSVPLICLLFHLVREALKIRLRLGDKLFRRLQQCNKQLHLSLCCARLLMLPPCGCVGERHTLPQCWQSCCYPAMVTTGMTIYPVGNQLAE